MEALASSTRAVADTSVEANGDNGPFMTDTAGEAGGEAMEK